MFRRLTRLVAISLVALAMLVPIVTSGARDAAAQDGATTDAEADAALEASESSAESSMDLELYDALANAGLVDQWLSTSLVSEEVAFLQLTGSLAAGIQADLLAQLEGLGRRNGDATDRLRRSQDLTKQIDILDDLIVALQAELDTQALSLPGELSDADSQDALATLSQLGEPAHQLGFALDPLTIAHGHFDDLMTQVRHHVQVLGPRENQARITVLEMTSRLGNVRLELEDLAQLAKSAQMQSQRDLASLEPAVATLTASFSEFHESRLLSPTIIDGISLVAIDAYVRGADGLGSCPVDWSLLAGIGRVESRHGTLGESSVGSSGRVTVSILGPLLDGGATEREALEAAAAAEAQAQAELDAIEAEAAAVAEWFSVQLWGEPEPVDEDAEIDPLYGDSQPPADEEEVDPLYGDIYAADPDRPRLDDGDSDDTEGDDVDGQDSDEDVEEEPEGNGFAVIVDTDSGRLDGNDRWDRAVGPMQFIPETWSNWATDGNSDGVADPQNIYDAARSAGRFLCDLSQRRGSSPTTFVLGYNSSSSYVRSVLSYANSYGQTELGVPQGG